MKLDVGPVGQPRGVDLEPAEKGVLRPRFLRGPGRVLRGLDLFQRFLHAQPPEDLLQGAQFYGLELAELLRRALQLRRRNVESISQHRDDQDLAERARGHLGRRLLYGLGYRNPHDLLVPGRERLGLGHR